jgi:hypothetical protein
LIAQQYKLLFQNPFVTANPMAKEICEKWSAIVQMSSGMKTYYPIQLVIIYTKKLANTK